MIVDTVDRLKKIVPFKNIRFVVDKQQVRILRKTIKGVSAKNIVLEPFGRNTASAIGLATIKLPKGSIMAVFPSDAHIDNDMKFKSTIKKSIDFVDKNIGAIACVGVKPDHPSVDYGYIETSHQPSAISYQPIKKVKRFVEKPNLITAKKYIKKNNMYWNAGIYVFKALTMIEAMKKHAKKLHENLVKIKKNKKNLESAYKAMDNVSIDYQIMEKYKKLYCVKAEFKWSDLGTWKTMEKICKKNKKNNIQLGQVKLMDAENVAVYGLDNKKVSIIGVNDIVVVSTDEGVLVSHKDKLNDVNKIGWL